MPDPITSPLAAFAKLPANDEQRPGRPFIVTANGTTSLHFDISAIQSRMRNNDPTRLVLGYTRTMMGFLLFNPSPRRIAMIGLGGGSIPKYCFKHLPYSEISVAEIDAGVIALRTAFAIPDDCDRFEVICMDGAEFVKRNTARLDVLIVDGFNPHGMSPQLCTQQFYDDCYSALTEAGVMVVNMTGQDYRSDAFVSRMCRSFGSSVIIVKAEDSNNRIAFAFKSIAPWHSPGHLEELVARLESDHPIKFGLLARRFKVNA